MLATLVVLFDFFWSVVVVPSARSGQESQNRDYLDSDISCTNLEISLFICLGRPHNGLWLASAPALTDTELECTRESPTREFLSQIFPTFYDLLIHSWMKRNELRTV